MHSFLRSYVAASAAAWAAQNSSLFLNELNLLIFAPWVLFALWGQTPSGEKHPSQTIKMFKNDKIEMKMTEIIRNCRNVDIIIMN